MTDNSTPIFNRLKLKEKILIKIIHFYTKTYRINAPKNLPDKYLIAALHEEILPLSAGMPSVFLVTSKSRDGDYSSALSELLGHSVVRGSSSRGGVEVLKTLLSPRIDKPIGIGVDGPRGPRRKVKVGVAYLAKKKKWPVYCLRAKFKGFRLNSWDKTHIPYPFEKIHIIYDGPLTFEEDSSLDEIVTIVEDRLLNLIPGD